MIFSTDYFCFRRMWRDSGRYCFRTVSVMNNQSTIFSDECKVCVPSCAQCVHPLKAVSSRKL